MLHNLYSWERILRYLVESKLKRNIRKCCWNQQTNVNNSILLYNIKYIALRIGKSNSYRLTLITEEAVCFFFSDKRLIYFCSEGTEGTADLSWHTRNCLGIKNYFLTWDKVRRQSVCRKIWTVCALYLPLSLYTPVILSRPKILTHPPVT